MEETYFSDDDLVDINNTIDEVIFGDDADKVILVDEPIEPIESVVKDNLAIETERQIKRGEESKLRRERNKDKEAEFQKETDNFSKELKNRARKESVLKIWERVFFIFKPSSWIKLIQVFEPLLLTLFIDSSLILILFSLLYIMYIILNVSTYSHFAAIFKILGATLLVILCTVIQLNSSNSESSNKEG